MNRREFMLAGASVVAASTLGGRLAFAQGKPLKIGYNVATLANPFFQGMTKGVVDAVKKYPGMTLLNTNANGDANTQSTMVVDLINQGVDALILNPGAWTHYSYAIRDALEITGLPAVEVHLSDVESREEWRRTSVIRDLCIGTVSGKGASGYREALELLLARVTG